MKEKSIDHEIPDFMKQLNDRVRVEARRKLRKLVAIVVILCLVFGLVGFLCGRASASEIPQGYYDFETLLISMGVGGVPDILDYVEEHFEEYPFVFCFFDSWDLSLCLVYMLEDEPYYNSGTDSLYGYDSPGVILWCDSHGIDLVQNISFSSQWLTNHSYGYFYYGFDMTDRAGNESVILPANLDLSFLMPDHRVFNVIKKYDNGNYWIYFEASPLEDSSFESIRFTYTDSLGTFDYTVLRSDLLRISTIAESPTEVWTLGYINPNVISEYKFTLNAATLVSSDSDFGSVAVQLDLIFNDSPFPLQPGYDSVSSYNTYNSYSSIGVVGGGISTFEIGYLDNNQSLLSWRESTGKVHQPFRLSWIVLPDFLWDYGAFQFADFNLEEMYQLFESYDVVILGVGPAIFNDLYPDHVDPAGVKDNYDFVKSAWQLGLGVDYCISVIDGFESPYRSCNRADSAEVFTVTRSSQCGFIWTRNFILKQVSWYCGDTSERLLEFESRLVDENDGVLTKIQEKLVLAYEQDNFLLSDILSSVDNAVYALNSLDFGALDSISDKLDHIIDYLDFDIDIDVTKLARPWSDIFLFAKKMFDDSAPMWDSISSSASTLYDGLPLSNQYDVESLPDVCGPIPLFPTIAPVPVIPTLSPTPVPIGSGGLYGNFWT